jgi:hypothetical protein
MITYLVCGSAACTVDTIVKCRVGWFLCCFPLAGRSGLSAICTAVTTSFVLTHVLPVTTQYLLAALLADSRLLLHVTPSGAVHS